MSLASLPTELIEQIASHLDLSSFRHVRLTCSSIRQQTLHHFKDRYFRKRTLQWTNESLKLLVEVTGHVDFGDELQHLVIDATPRKSIRLWQTRKRISEAQAVFGSHKKSPLKEQYQEDHKIAEDLATFFKETRYDQKCVISVFRKLGKLKSISFEYEGMDKKYGKFGRRYCEIYYGRYCRNEP
ncbi:Nn.00g014840.m01.CDS01 [Neocucurbitaria sp. VM-36]